LYNVTIFVVLFLCIFALSSGGPADSRVLWCPIDVAGSLETSTDTCGNSQSREGR
ncbi:hypothetical protein NPIL_13341, partial [Nephila pilipes]